MHGRRQGNQTYASNPSLIEIKRQLVRLRTQRVDSAFLVRMLAVGEVVAINRRRRAFFYDLNGTLYSRQAYKARAKNLIALPDLAKGGSEDIGVAETFD